VIVGAGFTGAVLAERLASQTDKKVLLIDRRAHVGGNAYDYVNDEGHLVHQYGPHLFHTNSQRIVDYLSQFTRWRPYEHRVLGLIEGRLVPIPFNLTSLDILLSQSEAGRLREILTTQFEFGQSLSILKMMQSPDAPVRELAQYIYEKVFFQYSKKQWGCEPTDLSPSVLSRVPVRISYDDRYFSDTFQAVPFKGYTSMFERMLSHPNIDLRLGVDHDEVRQSVSYRKMIFTGAIDEFFDYNLGALPYRSLHFEFRTYRQEHHQPVATVNYPDDRPFTRITEMAHITGEKKASTIVTIEYPLEHVAGKTTPYYPIPREDNLSLYKRYLSLAERNAKNVIFAGRLGDYQYYNMDQAVGRSLALFERLAL